MLFYVGGPKRLVLWVVMARPVSRRWESGGDRARARRRWWYDVVIRECILRVSTGIAGKREKEASWVVARWVCLCCCVNGGALAVFVACWSLVAGKVTTETGVGIGKGGTDGWVSLVGTDKL